MRKSLPVAAAVLALAGPPPLAAQTPATGDALAEIATALTRIAEVMEKQLESSRLDLLMRRQDFSQRRLDRVENQLISASREVASLRQNVERSEMELARVSDMEEAQRQGWDPVMLEAQIESMEFDLEQTRRRIAELDGKIARLEQEKALRERELEDWQAFMDREISGLQ